MGVRTRTMPREDDCRFDGVLATRHDHMSPLGILALMVIACAADKELPTARSPVSNKPAAVQETPTVATPSAPQPSAAAEPSPPLANTDTAPVSGVSKPRRGACAKVPLLRIYELNGAVQSPQPDQIAIDVQIDLHSADCGAPDCYGHEMQLVLEVADVSGKCVIRSARGTGKPFGCDTGQAQESWIDSFVVTGSPDLASSKLRRVELRDAKQGHALVLLPDIYYFYENAGPKATLKPELEGEDAHGCCYGYTSSAAIHWRTDQVR